MRKLYLALIFLTVFLSSCMYYKGIDPGKVHSIAVGLNSPYRVLLEKTTDRERISSILDIIDKDIDDTIEDADSGSYDMMMNISFSDKEIVIKRMSADTFMLQNGKAFKSETLGKYFSELKSSGIQKLKTNPPIVKSEVRNYTKNDIDNIKSYPPKEIRVSSDIYTISDAIPEINDKYVEAAIHEAGESGLYTGRVFDVVSREMKQPYLPAYCIYSNFNNEKAWIINVIYSDYSPSDCNKKDRFECNSKLKESRSFVITPEGKLLYSN